jgi:HAMP domain-containing protein
METNLFPPPLKLILAFLLGVTLCVLGLQLGFKEEVPAAKAKVYYSSSDTTKTTLSLRDDPKENSVEGKLLKKPELFFHSRSQLLVWMVLISFLCGFSFAASPLALRKIRDIKALFHLSSKQQFYASTYALLFLFVAFFFSAGYWLFFFGENGRPMQNFFELMESLRLFFTSPAKVSAWVSILSNISSLLALVGLFSLMMAAGRITQENTLYSLKELALRFKKLDTALMFFLTILAITVCGGVITSVFNREAVLQAINASESVKQLLLPREFVYLYGLSFSVFLFLIYYPTRLYIKQKGMEILHTLDTLDVAPNQDKPYDASFEEVLSFKASRASIAKAGLFILSPLFSALINGFVGL